MITTANKINRSIAIGLALTSVSIAISFLMGWTTLADYDTTNEIILRTLEILSVATSYSCTYLCVMQSRWNYPIGAASTALLTATFLLQNLYGSAALNAYLLPTLVYGWFRWGKDHSTRPVTFLINDGVGWMMVYAAGTLVVYLLTFNLITYLGGQLAFMDAALFVLSIVAQFMLDNKKIENWAVWIVVNVISVYVYYTSGLYLLALQFAFFLGNALWGAYEWYKTYAVENSRSV
jgi:nicotinamide mononucleotide transporter